MVYFLDILGKVEKELIPLLDAEYGFHEWYSQSGKRVILNILHKVDDEVYNKLVTGEKIKDKIGVNPYKEDKENVKPKKKLH